MIANPSTTATAFTKAGAGTLTLNGANTYSGTTYVDAGTLIANAKATVDTAYFVAPGAVLDIGYSSVTQVSGPGVTVNGGGVGTAQVAFKAGIKYSVNGGLILQGAPTTITSYGTGANPQIFGYDTNATQISVAASASGSVLSSTVSPATYDYGLVISTVTGANTVTGDLVVNGPIVNNAVYAGDGLNKKGTGSLLLTAASTYVYTTNIQAGSIIASTVNNVLPVADTLTLGSATGSGQLLLTGISQQVASLATSGTGTANAVVGNSATAATLNVAYATTTAADVYAGAIGGAGVNQNNLSLTKSAAGQFNVSGTNTYTAGTFVTGGILEPINTYSLPGQTTPGSINASSGGTLLLAVGTAAPQFQAADVTNVLTNANFSSGSAIGLDTTFAGTTGFAYTSGIAGVENVLLTGAYNGSIGGAIATGAGTLLKTGLGTWTLNGADSFTGLTNVSSGTLVVNGDAGQAHSYLVAAGALLQLGYSSGGGYSGSITVNGGGVSNASSGVMFKGGVTFGTNGGFVLQTAPTTVTTYGTGTTTLSGFDVHSTFLTVANTASGSVFTSSLNFSTGSYGYTVNVASGANTATGDLTIAGSIIGTGNDSSQSGTLYAGLDKSGAGSLLLTGASTYAAGTAVTNGSIILSGGNNLLPIATTVQLGLGTNSGQLLLSGINQQVGSILAAGTGTANAILGNSATASTLTVTPTALDTYNGSIGGVATNANNLALAVTGTSILAVTGNNTYTGGTSVTGATLRVNNTAGSGTGTGPVTVAVGGTLGGSGNASGGVTVLGTITAGNSSTAIGTLTTGAQNWNTSGGSGVYLVKVSADGTTNDQLVMSNLTVTASPMARFTINLTGTAAGSLTGTPVLAVDVGGGTPAADPFSIGSLTLQVNGANAPATYGLSELPDTTLGGVDLVLSTAAPEPTSLLMLAGVIAPGLLGRRRASRRRA